MAKLLIDYHVHIYVFNFKLKNKEKDGKLAVSKLH